MKIDYAKLELAKAKACMTVQEICNAGFAKGTYRNICRGKEVKPATVGKLAKILKVDVTEIIEL